ncbi:hypothetical protein [Flavobacterium lindanitolerans]|jgi:hypothetical protein|uniref:hypothetical protein n=1 Tax=Flavobacterium lindanitolerans TaxID=428988 RepID=UPI0023F36901|nr:hypothetical protein [Flavobacterium lindanitolerans]
MANQNNDPIQLQVKQEEMVKIIFDGWKVGMKKIPFVKLLNERASLSLTDAKKLKDRLVDDNEIVEIKVINEKLAKEILKEAQKLKVKGKILFD